MLYGLLGEKLRHSYSPAIHNLLGDYPYELFEVDPTDLKTFMESPSFDGMNITIPYKKAVIPFCQKLSPQAKLLGAVNTVVRLADGSLIGHNTDYFGFQWMCRQLNISYENKKVLVLGSGGASATVCAVMKQQGAHVTVISRTGEDNYTNLERHTDCAVIINTTPVGMFPQNGQSPIDLSIFPHLEGVMDLIYNPSKTKLLLDAQLRGIPTVNGLSMLVAQAKESAEWFTGKSISNDVISTIYKKLKKQTANIVLIGMPGCGKSTIGKILSRKLSKVFIDTDARIEQVSGCNIPQIFRESGESVFRKLETQVLSEEGKKSGIVLATGGGCVTRPENRPLLRQNGIIIWIRRNLDLLATDGRPISQTSNLHTLYESRRLLYENFADLSVENNRTCEETAMDILKLLEVTL